jgi:hypothetical protein
VRRRLAVLAGAVISAAIGVIGAKSEPPAYELPPIGYSHATPHDAVARLLRRIAAGEVKLSGSDPEILRGVLRELNVPVASQILVFSRTSIQAGLIRPDNPRALYFSDSVYVGWVPGGLIEAVAVDPQLGPIFYAFNPQDARDARRTFVREKTCLRCHGGTFSRDIPALFERSVLAPEEDEPESGENADRVDDTTPFERRWGGWYVTGYDGTESHRGVELSNRFAQGKYLTTSSDVVALLVFQHQLAMHNSLTRAAQNCRRAPGQAGANDVLDRSAEDVVDHLLFRGAAPLPAGITGSESFRSAFAAGALRGAKGDALKDLSLHGRLFANRCSFLIYAESFTALPWPLKDRIFARLAAALRDGDLRGRYAYLEKDEKRRIAEVLNDTVPEAARRF